MIIDFGTISMNFGGKLYGPGKVDVDDSTAAGDQLCSDLESRLDDIRARRAEKAGIQFKRRADMLAIRAASGDESAVAELEQLTSSEEPASEPVAPPQPPSTEVD